MSIGKRVSEAIEKMEASDSEGALFAICAPIEATAVKEFNKKGRSSYKNFIHQNLGLITDIAFGGRQILNMNLAYNHPDLKKNSDGTYSFQDIIYHVVRCGHYHEAKIPDNLKFTQEGLISVNDGNLVLPSSLIYGLIIAVVVSPANSGENTNKNEILNLYNFPIPINKLWGKRKEFFWLQDLIREAIKIQQDKIGENLQGGSCPR